MNTALNIVAMHDEGETIKVLRRENEALRRELNAYKKNMPRMVVSDYYYFPERVLDSLYFDTPDRDDFCTFFRYDGVVDYYVDSGGLNPEGPFRKFTAPFKHCTHSDELGKEDGTNVVVYLHYSQCYDLQHYAMNQMTRLTLHHHPTENIHGD